MALMRTTMGRNFLTSRWFLLPTILVKIHLIITTESKESKKQRPFTTYSSDEITPISPEWQEVLQGLTQ